MHTHGPWHSRRTSNGAYFEGHAIWANGQQVISSCRTAADADLAAAAPELLATLVEAIRCVERDGAASAAAWLRTSGRAAIAKACRHEHEGAT